MKLDLKQVALFSLVYNRNLKMRNRVVRVLRYMTGLAEFKSVTLFDANTPHEIWMKEDGNEWQDIRIIPTDDLNFLEVQQFLCNGLPNAFPTEKFIMNVHEDGFILNPALWEPDFLKYDYIGAPWGDGVVGNEAFCIQSRRMLDARILLPLANHNSDETICRQYRTNLVGMGVQFAPTDVALRFATETTHQDSPSFGFHGRRPEHAGKKYAEAWAKLEQWEKENGF